MAYDLVDIKAPILKGRMLRLVARLSETPLIGRIVVAEMLRNTGIKRMRKENIEVVEEPITHWDVNIETPWNIGEQVIGDVPMGLIAKAYHRGDADPTEVVSDALLQLKADEEDAMGIHPMVYIFQESAMAEAAASSQRYQDGKPLGPLDGVPMVIKDVVDTAGVPTCSGTGFVGDIQGSAESDGAVVAKLRAAGAVILGKSISHELGMGVFGINPNHGTVRNPVNQSRMSGGSSSGSAAAVGAGFVPLAYGTDGGGSIRIPSSLCGVLGLKTTHGRISGDGGSGLCPSVGQSGPIASELEDLICGLAMMSGPHSESDRTQPRLDLSNVGDLDLSQIKIGIYRPWFEHADDEVVKACKEGLDALLKAGAELVEIEIPDLDKVRLAHLTTISREMLSSQSSWFDSKRRQYGGDIRVSLAMAKGLNDSDDVIARSFRHNIVNHTMGLFDNVDLIITPTTGCTAPPIPKGAEVNGLSDLATLSALMRFMHIPNLTGQPAITIPVGSDNAGLPIGLHLMARPWEEVLLLRCAGVLQD